MTGFLFPSWDITTLVCFPRAYQAVGSTVWSNMRGLIRPRMTILAMRLRRLGVFILSPLGHLVRKNLLSPVNVARLAPSLLIPVTPSDPDGIIHCVTLPAMMGSPCLGSAMRSILHMTSVMIGWRYGFKMVRIHAARIMAFVVNMPSLRDWPNIGLVHFDVAEAILAITPGHRVWSRRGIGGTNAPILQRDQPSSYSPDQFHDWNIVLIGSVC